MKISSIVIPVLLSTSAFASSATLYSGVKMGVNDSSEGTPCNLSLENVTLNSGKKLLQAEIDYNKMYLSESVPGNCTVLEGNLYPEGPYGGTQRLTVHLNQECSEVVAFHYQSGMKLGQPVGYTCGSIVRKTP